MMSVHYYLNYLMLFEQFSSAWLCHLLLSFRGRLSSVRGMRDKIEFVFQNCHVFVFVFFFFVFFLFVFFFFVIV